MKYAHALLAAILLLDVGGCGYHQVGSAAASSQNFRTLAVPIFHSNVQAYNTETVFTQAVVRELNTRTRYRVLTASGDGTFAGSEGHADAILLGTILSQTVTPLTYDPSSGQTSSYLVTISAQVVITAHDGQVLYRNEAFSWHEQYQSTEDLSGFVQEDPAAVRRLAKDFAESLVSDILEGVR